MATHGFSFSNVFFFAGIALFCAVASAGESNTGGWLDVIRVKDDGEAPPLALVLIKPLNPPLTLDQLTSVREQYKTILPKGENRHSFTDPVGAMAFMVMRPQAGLSAKSLGGARVVGLVYAHILHKDERPEAFWSGRLVHSRPMEQTYLVLARSEERYLTIAIFPVDPERNVGKYPLDFPLAKLASWPKPLQPISEKVTRFELDVDADIREINVVPDKNGLLIAAQLAKKTSAPHYFRYDFENKTWTTAYVAAGEPLK